LLCQTPKKKKNKTLPKPEKIKTNITEEPLEECPFSKINENKVKPDTLMTEEAKYILNLFNNFRKYMPMENPQKTNYENPDYCIFGPPNILKTKPDFYLFICDNDIINKKCFTSEIPSIYAICTDDVSFYKVSDIRLPYM